MKALFVVAPSEFRDEEYFEPKKVLEDAGVETETASKMREAESSVEKKKIVTKFIGEAKAEDYDAVVFVGGKGASCYFNDSEAHELARKGLNARKVVSAVCIAPAILANAGLLKGKKATCYPSVRNVLEKGGAICTGADVERDGNIVTASGPQAATAFGTEILRAIQLKSS